MLLIQMTANQLSSFLMSSPKTQLLHKAMRPQAHGTSHQCGYRVAWEHIQSLEGKTVDAGTGADKITWQVVKEVTTSCVADDGFLGVKPEYGFDKMSLADAFLLFWPGDTYNQLKQLNKILA